MSHGSKWLHTNGFAEIVSFVIFRSVALVKCHVDISHWLTSDTHQQTTRKKALKVEKMSVGKGVAA